jgi:hypothetical protein
MMKSRKFIGRKEELEKLERIFEKKGFKLVIVTGRRRIGKTRLINEFLKGKEHLRVQFEKRNLGANILKMNEALGIWAGIPNPNFSTLTDIFRFLSIKGPKVIALDEFSYLIKYTDALAEFQTVVDEVLSETDIMLIVSGSSYSIMKRGLLEHSSPLYGRSEAMVNLQPLSFKDLSEWFPSLSVKDLVIVHSACGGVPRYLEMIEAGPDIRKEVENLFFERDSFLFREAKEVLEEEFDDPSTYYSILEAVSKGATTVTHIGNMAMLEPKNTAKYLDILVKLGLLRREFPFNSGRKKGIYRLKDPYFAFWFKFLSPFFEDIESGFDKEARNRFRTGLDTYLGVHFEYLAPEIMISLMPFEVEAFGRWWHKGEEIDLIMEGKDSICFIEVKWGRVLSKDAERELHRLREKSTSFHHNKKTTYYGLFASEVPEKDPIRSEEHLVWDLDDY